jgi:hypothetical protein
METPPLLGNCRIVWRISGHFENDPSVDQFYRVVFLKNPVVDHLVILIDGEAPDRRRRTVKEGRGGLVIVDIFVYHKMAGYLKFFPSPCFRSHGSKSSRTVGRKSRTRADATFLPST